MKEQEIIITTESIKLAAFLKFSGVVSTGGQAGPILDEGLVSVNGEVETRKGKQLRHGDQVRVDGQVFRITRMRSGEG